MSTRRTIITPDGREVVLARPALFSVRASATATLARNEVAAMGACLGVCWLTGPSPGGPRARIAEHRHDYIAYGLAVVDELAERGWTLQQIAEAAGPAIGLLSDGPSVEGVEGALGNSEAAPAAGG